MVVVVVVVIVKLTEIAQKCPKNRTRHNVNEWCNKFIHDDSRVATISVSQSRMVVRRWSPQPTRVRGNHPLKTNFTCKTTEFSALILPLLLLLLLLFSSF